MEELIKWIIDNKGLVFLLCLSLSVSVPISIHFGTNIIHPPSNDDGGGTNNNTEVKETNVKRKPRKQNIELISIRLYSTGKKGKVFTTTFRKMLNHNFGVEVTLKNHDSIPHNVKVGWCIYKGDKKITSGTFKEKINANATSRKDFFVNPMAFNKMKIGEYKSLFWVNDQKVQKVYFEITNK